MKRLLGVLFLAVAFIAAAFAFGSFWLYLICKGLGGCSEASYAYFIFTGLLISLLTMLIGAKLPRFIKR